MRSFYFLLFCLVAFSVGLYGQEVPEELTPDDIIEMVQARRSETLIIQKIQKSTFLYEPSAQDIVQLRKAGASDRIIQAVLEVPMTPKPEASSGGFEKGAYSRFEVFGGYSYGLLEGQVDLSGWNITSTNHFNNWFGITFDGSGYYSGGFSQSMYTFFAGPQFSVRVNQMVTPFIRGLAGGAYVRPGLLGVITGGELGYAYGAGGGVDVKINEQFAVRAAQVDFIRLQILGVGYDQVRASFGVVGRW